MSDPPVLPQRLLSAGFYWTVEDETTSPATVQAEFVLAATLALTWLILPTCMGSGSPL